MADGTVSACATAPTIAALGFVVALAGDACHVASGATRYEWDGVPEIWRSQVWFPFLVAGAVLAAGWAGRRDARVRSRADVAIGAALVLALYALTAVVDDEPATVSVVLCGAMAVAIWAWWDPSRVAFVVALSAAVLGPFAEIVLVELGAASYADDALFGVAPWLPCLYFGAGAVASGLWAAWTVTIVPANEASWEDLEAVFGTRGDPSRCYCQRYKIGRGGVGELPRRGARLPAAGSSASRFGRRAVSSPISTASPPAGARWSRAPRTRACCSRPASPGTGATRTRPTTASGP